MALHFYGKRQWAVVWWSVIKEQERILAGKCTIIQGLWSSWYVRLEKGHADETRGRKGQGQGQGERGKHMPVTYDACWLSLDMNAHGHLQGGTDGACGLCGVRDREHDQRLLRNEISEQRTPSRPCVTPRPHRYHGTSGIKNSCDYGINSSLLSLRQSLSENKPIKKAGFTFNPAVDAGKTWMFVFSKST